MKEIKPIKQTFTIEITRDEVELIRKLAQFPRFTKEESDDETALRVGLYVGASRLLGYNVNDDGSANR